MMTTPLSDTDHLALVSGRRALVHLECATVSTDRERQAAINQAITLIDTILKEQADIAARSEMGKHLASLHERFVTSAEPAPTHTFPAALRQLADEWEPF